MKRRRIIGLSAILVVIFGISALLYIRSSKIEHYDFPFSEEDIDRVELCNILENKAVQIDDLEGINNFFALLTSMRINGDDPETDQNNFLLGNQGFVISVYTDSGDEFVYQYDQHNRTASGGSGIFDDGSQQYSVEKLDLTRIWTEYQNN